MKKNLSKSTSNQADQQPNLNAEPQDNKAFKPLPLTQPLNPIAIYPLKSTFENAVRVPIQLVNSNLRTGINLVGVFFNIL